MLVFALAAAAFHAVRALPQSGPSPVLSARQEVVTSTDGITKTVSQNAGSNKAVTIGATAGVIVGFIALVLVGIWFGWWRKKKNDEWRRVEETKNLNRLTMKSQRPGSVPMTPTSSIGSTSKMGRKSSALSLTPSTTSSFASSGVPHNATPPHDQRRPAVLHHPAPRTPSNLVQNSLLHQHSEYPPPPQSNDRPDALNSNPPELNRTSLYAQQPSRPSPLSISVTLPPSEAPPLPQSQHSFEPPSRHYGAERDASATPPSSRSPPSFQPPRRKSRADMNLTIVIPPHQEVPRTPPGLENGGHASANSMRSAEMGRAL